MPVLNACTQLVSISYQRLLSSSHLSHPALLYVSGVDFSSILPGSAAKSYPEVISCSARSTVSSNITIEASVPLGLRVTFMHRFAEDSG
jgi:hypothetical protein